MMRRLVPFVLLFLISASAQMAAETLYVFAIKGNWERISPREPLTKGSKLNAAERYLLRQTDFIDGSFIIFCDDHGEIYRGPTCLQPANCRSPLSLPALRPSAGLLSGLVKALLDFLGENNSQVTNAIGNRTAPSMGAKSKLDEVIALNKGNPDFCRANPSAIYVMETSLADGHWQRLDGVLQCPGQFDSTLARGLYRLTDVSHPPSTPTSYVLVSSDADFVSVRDEFSKLQSDVGPQIAALPESIQAITQNDLLRCYMLSSAAKWRTAPGHAP